MKVTARQLIAYLEAGESDEEGNYMQYDDMMALLMFRVGLSESEARKLIREDVFRGLLTRTREGYRVNLNYTFEIVDE